MSNTNKNGPSKFKISVVTRISIMFITHTIISKILVNILFVTFISIMAVKQQSLDGTGYASSILIILLHNPNHNLTMVVLQLVWLRICSSSRPPYQHIRCEALEWLRKADKSKYLFSLFCFTVSLLNWRALKSFARSSPYIVETNSQSVLQRSSSTGSFHQVLSSLL